MTRRVAAERRQKATWAHCWSATTRAADSPGRRTAHAPHPGSSATYKRMIDNASSRNSSTTSQKRMFTCSSAFATLSALVCSIFSSNSLACACAAICQRRSSITEGRREAATTGKDAAASAVSARGREGAGGDSILPRGEEGTLEDPAVVLVAVARRPAQHGTATVQKRASLSELKQVQHHLTHPLRELVGTPAD